MGYFYKLTIFKYKASNGNLVATIKLLEHEFKRIKWTNSSLEVRL